MKIVTHPLNYSQNVAEADQRSAWFGESFSGCATLENL